MQVLGEAIAHTLHVHVEEDGRRVDGDGREADGLERLRRSLKDGPGGVAEGEARLDAYALLVQHVLVDGRAALGRARLEAAVLVAEQKAAAHRRRHAHHRIEEAVEIELAEEALHGHAVEREPDLGYAQVEEAADDVALAEAVEVGVRVDLGARPAGIPELEAVEAVRVDVGADADGLGAAVAAVRHRLELSGRPADAKVRLCAHAHRRYEVDLDLEVPLLVHRFALIHSHHDIRTHAMCVCVFFSNFV